MSHKTSALTVTSLDIWWEQNAKPWQSLFSWWNDGKCFCFLADRFRTQCARCVFCFLSLSSCVLTLAPCWVQQTVLGQVHPIILCPFTSLSILSHIYSPERQSSVLDVMCWLCGMLRVGLNSLLLSKGTFTAVFFLGHSGLASTCLIKKVKFSAVSDLAVFVYMCALGCIWNLSFSEKLGNRACYMYSLWSGLRKKKALKCKGLP